MRAIDDFVAYWKAQCLLSGGTATGQHPTTLTTPIWGAYPLRGLLLHPGPADDIGAAAEELVARGLPFAITTAQDASAVTSRLGMYLNVRFAMVETAVRDMGEPNHDVEWTTDGQAFTNVQAEVHDIPIEARADVASSWTKMAADGKAHLAIVRDGDQPVGCLALFTGARNAGLYAGSVLSSHRRQGIAKSLLQAAMQRARKLDLDFAVGATTSDGHALTSALGFDVVGHVNQYVWFPEAPAQN